MKPIRFLALLIATIFFFAACGDETIDNDWLDEYGVMGPFDAAIEAGKEDGVGALGPQVSWDRGDSRVWDVTRRWADVTNEAGIAWSANSGLNWNQKYAAWLQSLEPIQQDGRTTFELVTPNGRRFPAPVLECAEVAIFLRVAFASWYGLPFYMEARDGGRPIYLGHFGFLRSDGTRYGNSPAFRTRYADHTGSWRESDSWPVDANLQGRGLYGGGDEVSFLPPVNGNPARAGAYFDAVFLNKRVGHFMMLALSWFGSIHLADGANMFHVQPEATRAGDLILHRWQRRGIGHVVPIMGVSPLPNDRFEVDVAHGSMPRRLPVWESGNRANPYFTSRNAGGEGANSDGDRYAALGGGLRRWRVAVSDGSRYRNTFLDNERAVWIPARDLDAIASRPERFRTLLSEMTPGESRQLVLERIESARAHLRNYPASCAARSRREEAFGDLYRVSIEHFGMDRDATDAAYRIMEDYAFAELEYGQSKTCCWNSTTNAMYEIIMDLAASHTDGECEDPLVFRARNDGGDGFELFRTHARALGKESSWVVWSADESCPQAGVAEDTEKDFPSIPWCELDAGDNASCSGGGPTRDEAVSVGTGRHEGNYICENERHFWSFSGSGRVTFTIEFDHSYGDLDITLTAPDGSQLDRSAGTGNTETVTADLGSGGTAVLEVFGYGGAGGAYALIVEADGGESVTCSGGGPTREEAVSVSRGRYDDNYLCADERHFWSFSGAGVVRFTIEFDHSYGDLDLSLTTRDGLPLERSAGTSNTETVTTDLGTGGSVVLEVYGYQGAGGAYDLVVQ